MLHTGLYSQLVAMEIPVGGDIGDEVRCYMLFQRKGKGLEALTRRDTQVHTVDQILVFNSGRCRATVAGVDRDVEASDVVVVPAGTQHQFVNTGDKPLELITIYSPAEHDSQTVHRTKEEGDQEEEAGRDEPPEWSQRGKEENKKLGLVQDQGGPY